MTGNKIRTGTLGKDPTICTMDGERYIIRIPSIRTIGKINTLTRAAALELSGMEVSAADKMTSLLSQKQDYLVRRRSAAVVALSWASSMSVVPNGPVQLVDTCSLQGDWTIQSAERGITEMACPVRLMLIPLDKDGCVSHDLDENPDGCLVQGGCLYRPGKAASGDDGVAGLGYENLCKQVQAGELLTENILWDDGVFIGDTSDEAEPLEWICAGGRLVSANVLGSASLRHLWGTGMVFYNKRERY